MGLIVIESRLIELFKTLPVVTDNDGDTFKPLFDFGTEDDLIGVITNNMKTGGVEYPLIWVETPFVATGKTRIKSKINFILATRNKSDETNKERLDTTIIPILNSLLENMIKAFNQSGFTKLLNRDKETRSNHFNYGVKETGQKNTSNATTDVWDAVKFGCELEFDDCPIQEIIY